MNRNFSNNIIMSHKNNHNFFRSNLFSKTSTTEFVFLHTPGVTHPYWKAAVSFCGLVTLCFSMLLAGGCGRSENRSNAQGPCVYDSECGPGYRCINSECVPIVDGGEPDAMVLKEFGEPCEENEECRSTYCLPNPLGSFCTHRCVEGCPPGWQCADVLDPHGGGGRVDLCAVVENRLCQPCVDDSTCSVTGADKCLTIGLGSFCGIDCSYNVCPQGYTCTDVDLGGGESAKQCIPDSGTCLCSEETQGMVRGCQNENEYGTCYGYETCETNGWSECSARTPMEEICNGLDDDCNGFVDEGLEPSPCQITNEFGTCHGMQECQGSGGWICDAMEPEAEVCDGVDNNCNELTDESFVDYQGRYITKQHCGSCGTDCDLMIPHASQTECRLVDEIPRCRALSCEEGYFLYLDGAICLQLPANLCEPCGDDDDCMAPGSTCIEMNMERFCGRDCSPQSPYGAGCPEGYTCQPVGPVLQCVPITGTCICNSDTENAIRSCTYDTCSGFQECEQTSDGYAWTECNVEDYNEEICDGTDSNCNGVIDEGFLNPDTGRYESDEHCGFCNNDCSKYWSADIHHVTGICDLVPPMPECMMGPCHTEMEGGELYEWVDVNGEEDDGCECRRIFGNISNDTPDLIDFPQAGHEYIDENCDGVDGVEEDALFVWADYTGSAGPPNGSRTRPYTSINDALAVFSSSGAEYILVAEGTYQENIVLFAGVQLHGGYSANFLNRDVASYSTIVKGQTPSGGVTAALQAQNIQNATTTLVSGFVIMGRDVETVSQDSQPGQPTYAVYLRNCDNSVVLRSNWIIGGRGGEGGSGTTGEAGYGRQVSTELDGAGGINALRMTGDCFNMSEAGGSGGTNSVCPSTNANPGGSVVCPEFTWSPDPYTTPHQGAHAHYHSNIGNNGQGGYDWSFDDISGSGCSHATESGWPLNMQARNGQSGFPGPDGAHGNGGIGGEGAYGSFQNGTWTASPLTSGEGTQGDSGQAGGGGGGGGGVAYYNYSFNDCNQFELGPTGGGGGSGGCGGQGGKRGGSGGASIAVLISKTTALSSNPQMLYNWVQRGPGGKGGNGGFGGMGGIGGRGGFGGGKDPGSWISAQAGKGGDGGNGGSGGGGGGGSGGPSYGIIGFDINVITYNNSNDFLVDPIISTGGLPGSGGGSVGPNSSGDDGSSGASRNLMSFQPCGPGGSCPSQRYCDPNNICIPNI